MANNSEGGLIEPLCSDTTRKGPFERAGPNQPNLPKKWYFLLVRRIRQTREIRASGTSGLVLVVGLLAQWFRRVGLHQLIT